MSSFCPNCGAPTAGERFCGSCGQALDSAPAASAPDDSLEHTRIAGSRIAPDVAPDSAPQGVADSGQHAQASHSDQPAEPQASEAPQWGAPAAPQAPAADQWAAPAAPQAEGPQWGAPPAQQPQAQQWGAPQEPQQQWGAPSGQQPQQPDAQQWGAPSGQQPPQQWGQQPQQPAQQWGQQPQQQWGAPQPQQWAQHAPAQHTPMHNPFKGTSIGDWVRDAGAVLLGFLTMGYVWSGEQVREGDKLPWWVIIAAILTALSVVVSYVPRLGAIRVPTSTAWFIKVGLNAASLVSILLVLVMELVHLTKNPFEDGGEDGVGGIGLAVWVLTAAVALAVAPRSFEKVGDDRLWHRLVVIFTGVGLGALLVSAIGWVIKGKLFGDESIFAGADTQALVVIGALIATFIVPIVVFGLPLLAVLKRRSAGALVLGSVGLGLVVSWILVSGSDTVEGAWGKLIVVVGSLGVATPILFLAVAGAVLALSAPVLRASGFADSGAQWLETARLAAVVGIAGLALWIVGSVLTQIGTGEDWDGSFITLLVLAVLIALLLGGVAATLPRTPGSPLMIPVLAAGLASVLGLVALIVTLSADGAPGGAQELVSMLVLPLLATGVLVVPPAMRKEFPKLFAGNPAAAQPQWGAPAQQAPQQWGAPGQPQAPQQQWGQPDQQQWGAQPQAPQQQWGQPDPQQQWGAPQAPQQQWGQPDPQQQWAPQDPNGPQQH